MLVLILVLILVAGGFKFFNFSFLASFRYGCIAAVALFGLQFAEPLYRMEVLGEKPGTAVARSRNIPMMAAFVPRWKVSEWILGDKRADGSGGVAGGYARFQKEMMDFFGTQSFVTKDGGHAYLQFVQDGRTYATDNGCNYHEVTDMGDAGIFVGRGLQASLPAGSRDPVIRYLFAIIMTIVIVLTYPLEWMLSGKGSARVPFESRGLLRTVPQKQECRYRKSGGQIVVARDSGTVEFDPAQVERLKDAPDLYFHPDLGHFQFIYDK